MSEAIPQPAVVPALEGAAELLLIRHGRSADVIPGSTDSEDPPLHDEGAAQATALAHRLGEKRIDAVYSSDLRRAVSTAEPLATARGLSVTQLSSLREVFLGEWERGEFRRRAFARDPEFLRFAEAGRWDLVPGSEGDDAFRARVSGAIGGIAADHFGQTVAIVCHGGVINAYLAEVLEIHRSFVCPIENTSVTLVRCSDHGRVLVAVNDCHHLYDPVIAGPALD